jgi:hypothetical protein
MKRRIVEVGGAIVVSLVAYLSFSIVSSLPALSLIEPGSRPDATFSDLAPEWRALPTWRLKWTKLRTFCAGLCTDEELMR